MLYKKLRIVAWEHFNLISILRHNRIHILKKYKPRDINFVKILQKICKTTFYILLHFIPCTIQKNTLKGKYSKSLNMFGEIVLLTNVFCKICIPEFVSRELTLVLRFLVVSRRANYFEKKLSFYSLPDNSQNIVPKNYNIVVVVDCDTAPMDIE